MKKIPLLAALVLAGLGQTAMAESFTGSLAYKECSALASTDPTGALIKAEEWLKTDDSIGAQHCKAMALYGLKLYADSAASLSVVRGRLEPTDLMLRTYVTRQAARAWMLGNRSDAALVSLTTQINEMSQVDVNNATEARLTAELLVDRAKIREQEHQPAEAVQDLDHALSLRPGSDDVLMARAEAFAALGDLSMAKEDLQTILRVNPTHAGAVELMRQLRDGLAPAPPAKTTTLPSGRVRAN